MNYNNYEPTCTGTNAGHDSYSIDYDKPNDECGVFGIYSYADSSEISVVDCCYKALYALQHRGQDSCGIVVNDSGVFEYHKALGLVGDNFKPRTMERLSAAASGSGTKIALAHVRYSPKGQAIPHNTQPLVARHIKGPMSIAYNGNLINGAELREEYELKGGIYHSTGDTETIAYAVTEQRLTEPSIEKALEQAMHKLKGAYSVVIMSAKKLIAARDPNGFRPLCIGRLPAKSDGTDRDSQDENRGWVVASESCALNSIGATFVRDILPGEIVVIGEQEVTSITTHCPNSQDAQQKRGNLCVFEYIYVARPDSILEGASVHAARLRAGMFLAQEHPVEADIVVGVPDSGLDAALGYSRESGIPYGIGFIKNKYIGRTFIQQTQSDRVSAVKLKLNPLAESVKGKRVVIVDDSIVRGTTTGIIVELLREAGASEVHVRISSPPFVHPCYFGTDIKDRESLIACRMSLAEVCEWINADSLGYLSLEHVSKLAPEAECGLCDGCFSGNYPIEVPEALPSDKFDEKIQLNVQLKID
ncbi:MAG: amidophosphoribosyltransferase [Oscillospiraceae bacterium]|nr:amidophosphoribosyltransferase [Oscillospiraceae bacterium]